MREEEATPSFGHPSKGWEFRSECKCLCLKFPVLWRGWGGEAK